MHEPHPREHRDRETAARPGGRWRSTRARRRRAARSGRAARPARARAARRRRTRLVITTATALSAPIPRTRAASAIADPGERQPDRSAEHERHAQQRRHGQSREHRVRERLGAVGEPVEHDPDAERAARDADEAPSRPALRAGSARARARAACSTMRVRHDGERARRPGSRTSACPYVARSTSSVSVSAGRPEATWRRFRHSTASQASVWATSWVATSTARPFAREHVDQLGEPRRARRVEPGERLVEEHHVGVLQQRARDQHALALPARELAERHAGVLAQPDALERRERAGPIRASRPPPPRAAADARPSARRRAPRPDSPAASARSGAPCRSARARRATPRLGASSPSSARISVVLPPPLGPRTPTTLAACDGQRDVLEHDRAAAVAHGEAARLDQRPLIEHPCCSPVKPLTMASALAASIFR